MTDLAEFLLARIAETKAAAEADRGWADFVAEDCEAKRRIVEFYAGPVGRTYALQFLALPYADHPDYREEWRP